jgi:hypothetical protein
VFFFFPVATYIRGLYARADLVPHLFNNRYDPLEPKSSVRKSRGWKLKMTNNDTMNEDPRHLALIGTTDGVPLFREKKNKRSAWPFVLRCANLPDSLSVSIENVHLHVIAGGEFLELDTKANILRRRVRGPKSLAPCLSVIANDLIAAYKVGKVRHTTLQ